MSDSFIPYSPTNTSPPSTRTASNVIQNQLGVSLLVGNSNVSHKTQTKEYNPTVIYEPINIKTVDKHNVSKPLELTNEMLGLSIEKVKENGRDTSKTFDKRNSADTHFSRDTHMKIILGNSGVGVGRNVKYALDHIPGR